MADEEVTCPYCKNKMKQSQMGAHHFVPCDVQIPDPSDPKGKKTMRCNDLTHAGCQH